MLRSLPPVADGADGAERKPIPLPGSLAETFGLIEAGRTDVARVRLRKHLAVQPEDGFARFLFGLTYHRERRYSEAGPWLAEAIAREPEYDPPYYFAAWGRYYLGEPEVAGRLWTRHLALRPDAADSHFGLGLLDLEAGRPAEAERRFRRAIELEADLPGRERSVAKAWARLGDALADQDRVPEAREALERAVALWPDHHEAWSRLARVARRLGDGDAATRATEEAEAALARTRAVGSRRP
ncbi:MAG: tetratricopeptide repeat protein [Planctomycetota bacterium]